MKFLVDSELPPEICVDLRQAGHDAIHMDAFGTKDHLSVIATAIDQGRVLISRDEMLEIELHTSMYANLPIIVLQDLPEEAAALGSILRAALTPTTQAVITAGTITYIHSEGITCTGVRP